MTKEERLARFINAGQILAGSDPGWPARLARKLNMNRGYVAAIVAGSRPLNADVEQKLSDAIGEWWDQVRKDAQIVMRIRIELDVELSVNGGSDV